MLVLSSLGCGSDQIGPPRAETSGTVVFDGQPLQVGTIRFVPTEGTEGPKVSAQIVDGQFHVAESSGPVVGSHRVEIEAPAAGDIAMDDEAAYEELVRKGKRQRVTFVRIPAVYNSRSKLAAKIDGDSSNELQFDLTSSGT